MLELRYRPADIYEHPIVSQGGGMQGIVIEVGRNKQTGKIERITPVGVADRVLRFRGEARESALMKIWQIFSIPLLRLRNLRKSLRKHLSRH
jgi:hypothetical protein